MKRKTLLSIVALAALLAVPQGVKADDATVQSFGSAEATSWTTSSSTTAILTGSTVTLNGVVMTFCGEGQTWIWNSKNKGVLPNKPADTDKYDNTGEYAGMPNNSGAAVTSVAEGDAVPTHGATYKFFASKTGNLTITAKGASTGNSYNIYFFAVSDGKATGTINCVTPSSTDISQQYSVTAGTTYYFFQVSTAQDGYRCTLKGISFEETQSGDCSYTVQWVDGNSNVIKTDNTRSGDQGDTPTLTDSDKDSFYGTGSYYGKYYVYESDDASSQTIAQDGSTVVTVTCTTTEITTYSSGEAKTWAMIDDPTTWSGRTTADNYDGLAVTGTLSFESSTGRYKLSADGALTFAVQEKGYLVISGKGGVKLYVYNTSTTTESSSSILSGSSGKVYTDLVDASDGVSRIIRIVGPASGTNSIFSVSWIPTSSSKSTATTSLTLDSHGFATYYPAYTVTLPADATAYYFTALDMAGGTVTGVEIAASGTIPANAAVLVKSTDHASSTITLTATEGTVNAININSASAYESDKINLLYPAYSLTSQANGYTYYAYAKNTGSFKKVGSDVSIPEGKCYFKFESTPSAAREFLNIVFDDEETTGVNAVQRTERNIQNGEYYNLSGQRVVNPTKGLYIVNGKKVIIK